MDGIMGGIMRMVRESGAESGRGRVQREDVQGEKGI